MTLYYFDSSLILSILFNETRAEEALNIWRNCPIRVSSVLLKFETNISIRRRYKSQKNKISDDWLENKLAGLNKFLKDVFFTAIDENLENSISGYYEELSECKSLDAIHLAAALKISAKYNRNQIRICSFDNNMRDLALRLGFEINDSM